MSKRGRAKKKEKKAKKKVNSRNAIRKKEYKKKAEGDRKKRGDYIPDEGSEDGILARIKSVPETGYDERPRRSAPSTSLDYYDSVVEEPQRNYEGGVGGFTTFEFDRRDDGSELERVSDLGKVQKDSRENQVREEGFWWNFNDDLFYRDDSGREGMKRDEVPGIWDRIQDFRRVSSSGKYNEGIVLVESPGEIFYVYLSENGCVELPRNHQDRRIRTGERSELSDYYFKSSFR